MYYMKKGFTRALLALLICACFPSFATDNFWQKFDGKSAPSRLPMNVHPETYDIYTLTQENMHFFLSQIGTDPDHATSILLPTPGSTMREFLIWETPMMEAGLAEKFPEIRTYTAVAADNPGVSAKLDYTDFGLSAMIYDGANSYFIDPYSNATDGYYIVFYQKNLKITNTTACQFNHQESLMPEGIPVTLPAKNTAAKQNGSIRHIYRLAVSCTGEYAEAVVGMNPTKPQVMSKIIATVNRINGVYERELSVSFNLVIGNDDIIYTDPATDPYSCNLNLTCLINEVQTNIAATIDNDNYDIGHIFCTAGGGLAALSATCSNGSKAMGTSTTGGPDDFGVPLHEMGHQFGANHTFSANSGGCMGNGAEENDYEPGSGSTIMSYGGLCDPNNVATFSDNYFHVASLVEINNFLTTQGSSSGCGSTQNGLNSVNIPDIIDSFNIPTNTPFELRAPKAVASQPSAPITYNWEQFDLGNFGGTEAQNGSATSGPIMRSYLPDTNRLRDFPIARILDNSYTDVGERLPMASRTVRFKLTARSVYQGWGSFEFTDSVVRLQVGGSGAFRVTQPSTDQTWDPGETQTITWNFGTTDQSPIDCHAVNIYLSLDNGASFPILLVSNAPNTGTYDLTVPDVYTTEGRIKVEGLANVFYDVGKGKLNITGTNGIRDMSLNSSLQVYPNPASNQIHIRNKIKTNNATFGIRMYNLLGRQVWTGKMTEDITIPCSSFARGIYLIRITNDQTGTMMTYKVSLK